MLQIVVRVLDLIFATISLIAAGMVAFDQLPPLDTKELTFIAMLLLSWTFVHKWLPEGR